MKKRKSETWRAQAELEARPRARKEPDPHRPVRDGLPWKQETCGEKFFQLTILIARSRGTFPPGSLVSLIGLRRLSDGRIPSGRQGDLPEHRRKDVMDTTTAATPTKLTAELPKDGLCRILSLDGGGAKGFYTLGVLKEVEGMLQCPLYKRFDLVFGTSTGAIIAALIALGYEVDEIHTLYKEHVPRIMRVRSPEGKSKALQELATTVFADKKFEKVPGTLFRYCLPSSPIRRRNLPARPWFLIPACADNQGASESPWQPPIRRHLSNW
jgi:hypothetical protein